MCVLKCGVWSLKKAGIVGDKLCWWPLNLSTLHNYTCIKIGKVIDPKSAWDITELLVHPSKPGHGRGSAPYGESDSTSRPRAGPSWTVLNNAPVAKLSLLNMAWLSWTWLDSLEHGVALLNIPRTWLDALEHLLNSARNFSACSRSYLNSGLDTD